VTSDAPQLLAGSGDDAVTAAGEGGPPSAPSPGGPPAAGRPSATPAGPATRLTICPYLATEGGAWRAAIPVREHECTAVEPPVPLALEKQRRLCLTASHTTCATFLAAGDLRDRAAGHGWGPSGVAQRRPIPVTTPVLIDRGHGSFPVTVPFFESSRFGGQALLVGLLVVAFIAIALARLESGPAATPSPSFAVGAGSPAPTSVASAGPSTSPAASASVSPSASPGRTPRPSATAKPAAKTYKVKSGDSLSSIAARYGVTVAALKKANGMTSNVIRPGQVLKIP
jgi:LysM domain